MASKKLKKAIMAGIVGAVGAKALGQAKEMKTYLAEEGGDKAKRNYITKKAKPTQNFSFSKDKFNKAVKTIKDKGLNLGRGPNIKSTDSLAGDYSGVTDYMSKGGMKMVKARGGKMVNLKPTKLY